MCVCVRVHVYVCERVCMYALMVLRCETHNFCVRFYCCLYCVLVDLLSCTLCTINACRCSMLMLAMQAELVWIKFARSSKNSLIYQCKRFNAVWIVMRLNNPPLINFLSSGTDNTISHLRALKEKLLPKM